MFGFISRNILTGLITVLPVVLTVYLFYWLAVSAESWLGESLRAFFPEAHYWPGMGVIAGLIVLFLIGVLMHAYVVRVLFNKLEALLARLPVVKPIYRAMRDFFDYFKPHEEQEYSQVVAVNFGAEGQAGIKAIGFVTQALPEKLPEGFNDDDSVLVYLPLSYMIGGYAVLVPRSALTPLDMSMEEAMRFALTAGVTSSDSSKARPSKRSLKENKGSVGG